MALPEPVPAARLHMVRLLLAAPRLAALAQERRLRRDQDDSGYLVHDQLAALFQEGTVQPFRVTREWARNVEVLGYSALDEEALRERAASYAPPEAYRATDWEAFAVKPMPESFQPGRRLGFEVRLCPVVRLASARTVRGKDGGTQKYSRGREVDAWEHRRFLANEPDQGISREEAFRHWLAHRLAGAAELESARLTRFQRTRLVRKTHEPKRTSHVLQRPDATLQGTLTVADGERFLDLLTRGVGRHRAFGFGMLLLRAPE
ncbi:MAG: type I-E CRISPR-associated protein Cas6/Cse3/CasE [Acidobacteriota bacterium]